MQIDFADKTAGTEGAATPVSVSLSDKLAENGATILTKGVPDLSISSAPLLEGSDFDWDGLSQIDLSIRMAALHNLMLGLVMSLAPVVEDNALAARAIITETGVLTSGDTAMIGHASVGRAGTVVEASNVALLLCDFEYNYLTGQLLSADGGWAAGYGRSF
jgi:hypothetical protein